VVHASRDPLKGAGVARWGGKRAARFGEICRVVTKGEGDNRRNEGVVLGERILWIRCFPILVGHGSYRGIGPRGPMDDATSFLHVSSVWTLIPRIVPVTYSYLACYLADIHSISIQALRQSDALYMLVHVPGSYGGNRPTRARMKYGLHMKTYRKARYW